MRIIIALALLPLLAVSCQTNGSSLATARSERSPSASGAGPWDSTNCAETAHFLSKNGGAQYIPAIPSSGNYGGYFHYAPLEQMDASVGPQETFVGCVYDFDNIPIPTGYLYDWFGSWRIDAAPGSFSFGNRFVSGELESGVWVKKRTYYLFLYTSDGQLISSTEMGPLKGKKLLFPSPFANGLVYPGTSFELEIAHPAAE